MEAVDRSLNRIREIMRYRCERKKHSVWMFGIMYMVFFIWLGVVGIATSHGAEIVDRIVAVVNDDIITLNDFNQALKPYMNQIKSMGYDSEKEFDVSAKLQKDILDRLIDQKLTDQEIKKASARRVSRPPQRPRPHGRGRSSVGCGTAAKDSARRSRDDPRHRFREDSWRAAARVCRELSLLPQPLAQLDVGDVLMPSLLPFPILGVASQLLVDRQLSTDSVGIPRAANQQDGQRDNRHGQQGDRRRVTTAPFERLLSSTQRPSFRRLAGEKSP